MVLLSSTTLQAAENDLAELIKTGFDNNIEIEKLRNEMETIQRNLKLTKARGDWQADMNIDKQLIEDEAIALRRENSEQISVSINKNFAEDKVNVNPTASYNFDGSDVIYGVNMNIDLYPNLPSESVKNLLNLNNQLNQKQKELFNKQAELAKSWVDKYLQLVRLEENMNVLEEKLVVAEDNYEEVQKQIEIDEASQQDLLQAKIDLNEAEYNLKQNQQNFNQVKIHLLTELKLEEGTEIILNENNPVLIDLQDLTGDLNIDDIDKEQMVENVVKTSSQFASILNNKDYLERELKWLNREDAPRVSLKGSYDSETDFTASVNVSYNIFDSGVQAMTVENKKQEIEDSELSLEQLYQETVNNIDNLIDQVKLAQLELDSSQLKYDKVVEDTKIIEQQLTAGAVEKEVLINSRLNKKSSLINIKRSNDAVFLNKLDLLTLIRPAEIVKEVTQ